MKRILALALSLAMILALFLMAGCGDDPTETTGSSSTSGHLRGSGSETDNTSGTSGGSETTGGQWRYLQLGYRADRNQQSLTATASPTALRMSTSAAPRLPSRQMTVLRTAGMHPKRFIPRKPTPSQRLPFVARENEVMQELYNCTIMVEATGDIGTLIQADRTSGEENAFRRSTVKYGGRNTAVDGANYNLYNLGINFENPWWDQTYVDTYSIRKKQRHDDALYRDWRLCAFFVQCDPRHHRQQGRAGDLARSG